MVVPIFTSLVSFQCVFFNVRTFMRAGQQAYLSLTMGALATEFHRELVTLGPGSKGTDNVALKDGFNARIGKNW